MFNIIWINELDMLEGEDGGKKETRGDYHVSPSGLAMLF